MPGLSQFPYLSGALLLALLVAISAFALPARRGLLLTSGLLCLPFALFSFEYLPLYWDPKVVAFFICSPEDLIFSFSTGALAWLFADWAGVLEQYPRLPLTKTVRRYLLYSALGIGTGYAIRYGIPGTPVMSSTMAGVALTGAVLLVRNRNLLPLAFSGAWKFTLFYALFFRILLLWQPDFASGWKITQQLPWTLAGIPAFELIWALGFGCVWPVFVAHCLGISGRRGLPPARVCPGRN